MAAGCARPSDAVGSGIMASTAAPAGPSSGMGRQPLMCGPVCEDSGKDQLVAEGPGRKGAGRQGGVTGPDYCRVLTFGPGGSSGEERVAR